jgi:hypothetical protein
MLSCSCCGRVTPHIYCWDSSEIRYREGRAVFFGHDANEFLENVWERVTFGGLDNRTPRGPYPFQRDDAGGKVLGRGRVARVIRPITSYGPDAFKHVGAWTLFVAVP